MCIHLKTPSKCYHDWTIADHSFKKYKIWSSYIESFKTTFLYIYDGESRIIFNYNSNWNKCFCYSRYLQLLSLIDPPKYAILQRLSSIAPQKYDTLWLSNLINSPMYAIFQWLSLFNTLRYALLQWLSLFNPSRYAILLLLSY